MRQPCPEDTVSAALKRHYPVDNHSVFVTHPVFEAPAWGGLHPLSIARQSAVLDLCRALGWLPDALVEVCDSAQQDTLTRFHDAHYIAALKRASEAGAASASDRARFNFGVMENPIFPGVYERAAAAVGGSICAARHALAGARAFHPAGGTHHGKRDRASGFCYFNDPAFAVQTLLDADAAPVFYLDLDAHHGDGVEAAFAGDARVTLVSVHEQNRWPHTGRNGLKSPANAYNFSVPRGFCDAELMFLMHGPIADLAHARRPQSIVIVAGADCLEGDPLTAMAISNGAFWDAVEGACAFAPMQVVLGGGGYNPWTTARAWAGLWARLAGFPIPEPLPDPATAILKRLSCDLIDEDERAPHWTQTLFDPPNPGPVRAEVDQLARGMAEYG